MDEAVSDEELKTLGGDLASMQESIANTYRRQMLSGGWAKCPALAGKENSCQGGQHGVATDAGEGKFPIVVDTRPCPEHARRHAQALQAAILQRCQSVVTIAERYGLTEWALDAPMWQQLLARVDRQRPVTAKIADRKYDLAQLCALIERGCRQPSADSPHVLLTGPCGTGKTTLQAVLYLAAVEAGIDAAFVDSIELRMLAANLTSRWDETARTAKNDLERLIRRRAIFWSDVGDSTATEKAFPETVAAILERFTGRLVTSSNLGLGDLAKHPDITQRAVSRLTAGRISGPAIIVLIDGTDQRRHGMGGKEVHAL